uniref:Ubiquitin-like domain-containing protein n=1 Tax=Ditylenchus dipsaci TaxID=166011 RepID=A0A915DFZ3_9BILA
MDLYFEIMRKKTHILCQAKDTSTVLELKKIVEGILKISTEKQTLKKATSESRTEWVSLEDKKTLAESGFTVKNAKADDPAVIGLVIPEDGDVMSIASLSTPPPLPEAMRHRDQEFGESN